MIAYFVSPAGQVDIREIDRDVAIGIETGDEVSVFGRAWLVRVATVYPDQADDSRSFVRVLLEHP